MSGRPSSERVIPGRNAISVGNPCTPLKSGWTWAPLSELAELGTGHTPSRQFPEYWDGDVPWIGLRDANRHHGGVIEDTEQHVTELGLANSAARWLPKDTVCLSRTASVGYVVKMARPMATSQDFVTWSCGCALDPEYLMRALLAEGSDIRRFGNGSTHTTIYFPEVKAFHIALPPLPEQRRIVAKLDALDAREKRARADLDRIPALVARAKQAILAKAFRGELTADWRKANSENAAQKLTAVRESRKANPRLARRQETTKIPDFSMPGSWAWISPDEVAADEKYSIGIGPFGSNLVKSDYREAGVRLVFVRDIRRESFSADDARYVEITKAAELHQHLARPGDVLITKMGDPPGDSCVFPPNAAPAIITADCIKLTPHADLAVSNYLNFCIRSEQVQSQFKGITAGVAQQKVSLERFRQLALPIAPLAEQAEIVRRIESAFAKIDHIAADAALASKLLTRLDQAILTKAFRGELVPQDPIDEPAEALLDRIKAARGQAPTAKRRRKGA